MRHSPGGSLRDEIRIIWTLIINLADREL